MVTYPTQLRRPAVRKQQIIGNIRLHKLFLFLPLLCDKSFLAVFLLLVINGLLGFDGLLAFARTVGNLAFFQLVAALGFPFEALVVRTLS